jgi:hypothetical protein
MTQSLQTVSDTIIGILVFGCAFSTKSKRRYPVFHSSQTPKLPFGKKKISKCARKIINKNING